MIAAKTNSVEAVKLLLNKNADPNAVDRFGFTALSYGIVSENREVTELLLSKTTKNLDVSLRKLAESTLKFNQNVIDEVEKKIRDNRQKRQQGW